MEVLRLPGLVDGLVIDAVEAAVLHVDVVHRVGQFLVLIAHNHHAVFRLLAGDVLHVHVLNGGIEATAAHFLRLIVGVDFQHGLLALSHFHVPEIDVLDDAAAARVGLDAQHAVQVRRVHLAIFYKHVLAAARYFGADDHAAVPVFHHAVAHDDVLRRTAGIAPGGTRAAVGVAAALDGYAVVAGVEGAVLNKDVLARLGVATVAVGAFVPHGDVSHDDVLRQQRMHHPEG